MAKYSIPVWKMIVESIKKEKKTNEFLSKSEIQQIVSKHFATQNVNPRTIDLQIIFHCVNHPGNKHGGGLHEKIPSNLCVHFYKN
jgi:hypothetical protein